MFRFPQSLSAQDFLDRYWQKKPLFLPAALASDLPVLSADELGWLATLDDVESRIVYTERQGDRTRYRVEHGPFDDESLGALPPEDWTLLVQDVEKHLPELRRYLMEAPFVPDWRVDDLMVSFAAPGGSVGPHRDNYDVFLCQGTGRREWRLAPPSAPLESVECGGLSLLEPFADDQPITANMGDVLYLPPGIAHWGIASVAAITYSIGMRAPQASEFGAALGGDEVDDRFYTDPDLRLEEAEPGLISAQAIERARTLLVAAARLDDSDLARLFGRIVTQVKPWLTPEHPSSAETDSFLKSSALEGTRVHGMARLAFFAGQDKAIVFVSGSCKTVSPRQLEVFRQLCARRMLPGSELQSALKNPEAIELLGWLVAEGAIDLPQSAQSSTRSAGAC